MKHRLLVVGPLPPPYHGVTVSTSLVLANRVLQERFGISHPTLQIERGNGPHDCKLAPAHVI